MPKVEIYTTLFCGFCVRAKSLFQNKSVAFQEFDVGSNVGLRAEMQKRSGRSSVPQIFINDQHVGGCDELYALERSGKLDGLLAPQGAH